MKDIKFLNEFMTRLLNGSVPDICDDAPENTIVTASEAAAESVISVIEMMGLEGYVHMETKLNDGIATWHITFLLDERSDEKDYKVSFLCGDTEVDTKYFSTIEDACHAAICWDSDEPSDMLYVMRKDKVTGLYFELLFLADNTYDIHTDENDADYEAIRNALVEAQYID